jgi:hypothetical protein
MPLTWTGCRVRATQCPHVPLIASVATPSGSQYPYQAHDQRVLVG